MKAKFIYEKFKEESDPIKDIGIGGIDIEEVYNNTIGKARKRLKKAKKEFSAVFDNLIGKKIIFYPSSDPNTKITGVLVKWKTARFENKDGYVEFYIKDDKYGWWVDRRKNIWISNTTSITYLR